MSTEQQHQNQAVQPHNVDPDSEPVDVKPIDPVQPPEQQPQKPVEQKQPQTPQNPGVQQPQTPQNPGVQQPPQMSSNSKAQQEQFEKQLAELKKEDQVFVAWEKLVAYWSSQKLNHESTFAAIDTKKQAKIDENDFNIYIKDAPVDGLKSVSSQIFALIKQLGEGGVVTEQAWHDFWLQSTQQHYEVEHKIQILNQKQNIFQALETAPSPGQKLEDSSLSSKYQNMIEKIKNSSSLTDITQMFSSIQSSPFKRQADVPYQVSTQQTVMFDLRRDKPKSGQDSAFTQYRTPRKDDDTESMGRPSFLSKELPIQKSPSSIGLFTSKSPPVSNFVKPSVRPEVSTKVERQMNINIESTQADRQSNRTIRRKEDLNTFMSKVGLGKYDAPRVTVDLAGDKKSLRNIDLERLKNIVSGKDQSNRDPRKGLNDLASDSTFTNGTFKKIIRERGNSRSVSQGRESLTLVDQSLKNYTMKLIHQHKYPTKQAPLQGKSPLRKTSFQQSYLRNS